MTRSGVSIALMLFVQYEFLGLPLRKGSLSMGHVGPVPWNKEAFNRLVLKSKKRETIKALVTVHLTTVQNVDVVENKGNGLIILLHGPPGTGMRFFGGPFVHGE